MVTSYTLMEAGTTIVAARKLYGGSLNRMVEAFVKPGREIRFVDADDPESFRAAMDGNTRCVFVESLANPAGVDTDIAAIADIAHAGAVPLIVDNTMARPMPGRTAIATSRWPTNILAAGAGRCSPLA